MVLGEVEETVTSIEIDEETYEEVYKVKSPLKLFCFKTLKNLIYSQQNEIFQCYSLEEMV